MKITFKLINEQTVAIMLGDKQIGEIFTPSDSGRTNPEAIQVCGFDEFLLPWGCGKFGDGKGHAKKDIQLKFNENSQIDEYIPWDLSGREVCHRCYYKTNECKCDELVLGLDVVVDKL